MKEFNTQPPSGTRDFLPEDIKNRERIFSVIKQVFEKFGFLPMNTPAFERIENLLGKYGEESDRLIFKILKRGEQATSGDADLALRYDLTVPLARFFANYQNQLPCPFRCYQIGPVWRADRPGKGRFREFYQCDIDVVGTSSLLADAEVILALVKSLSCINLSGYVVKINSRKVLAGLLEIYGIPKDLRRDTLTAIDKLDKIGVAGVVKELKERGVPETILGKIREDLSRDGVELRSAMKSSRISKEGLKEVEEVTALVAPLLTNGKIEFSPFLVRGLNYYTGPIFEIYLKGAAGAIASGGRYDNLIGMFTGKQIPACGGSLGIDRIISSLKLKDESEKDRLAPQVFITVWDRASRPEILRIATELRDKGIVTEIFLEEGKIGKQIRLASKRNALYCLFYGPNEQRRKEVTLKNLSTGEQKNVKLDRIAKTLKTLLQRR
ncbi:MAG: histidine--tRNA ligase [Thermoprotei archaeon]|nr:MAG: histidine--tRNA ligase [Thermoprotei archaeon]